VLFTVYGKTLRMIHFMALQFACLRNKWWKKHNPIPARPEIKLYYSPAQEEEAEALLKLNLRHSRLSQVAGGKDRHLVWQDLCI